MDPIKEAFTRIKEDILSLKEEVSALQTQIQDLSTRLVQTTPTHNLAEEPNSTHQHTNNQTTPTHNLAPEGLSSSNSSFSIGNRGVPTDRQTNQQTNPQIEISLQSSHNPQTSPSVYPDNFPQKDPISEFKRANEVLSALDDLKKGIRAKFKDLTPQEMLVFSTLYALEEQKAPEITYKLIATQLNLSESSIRDYINKLSKKGVPIDKTRQNNKTILLTISQDLKNIASLETIQRLREL
jgi:predicted transcriptional regulator